jgi:hypothetical protein
MTADLKPCPFCGDAVKAEPWRRVPGEFIAMCRNDDCDVSPAVSGASIDELAEAWNRRAAPPGAEAPGPDVREALAEIAAERLRQMQAEGWSAEHDDEHIDGELAQAAASYALAAAGSNAERQRWSRGYAPTFWPFTLKWWKPKDRRRDLIRAAALIVAEIERLDRAALKGGA